MTKKEQELNENFELSKRSVEYWQQKLQEIYNKSLDLDNRPDEFSDEYREQFDKEVAAIFMAVEQEKQILSSLVEEIKSFKENKRKK